MSEYHTGATGSIELGRADVHVKNANLYWNAEIKCLVAVADIRGDDYGGSLNPPKINLYMDEDADSSYQLVEGGTMELPPTILSKTRYTRHEFIWNPLLNDKVSNTDYALVQGPNLRNVKMEIIDSQGNIAKSIKHAQLNLDCTPDIQILSPLAYVVGEVDNSFDVVFKMKHKLVPNKADPKVTLSIVEPDGTTSGVTVPITSQFINGSWVAYDSATPEYIWDMGAGEIRHNQVLMSDPYYLEVDTKKYKYTCDTTSYAVGTKITFQIIPTSQTL